MEGGLGQGATAAGGALVGVAEGAGHPGGDLTAGTQGGPEVVGEGEQGAPVLGRIEFVAQETVFGADARRCRGGVDDLSVAAVGALVKGAAGAGTEQLLQREPGDAGDGVQTVFGVGGGRSAADVGQLTYRAGPQERVDRFGGGIDDGPLAERGECGRHGGEQRTGVPTGSTASGYLAFDGLRPGTLR